MKTHKMYKKFNSKFGRRYRSSIISISSVDNTVQTLEFVVRKFGQVIIMPFATTTTPVREGCKNKKVQKVVPGLLPP